MILDDILVAKRAEVTARAARRTGEDLRRLPLYAEPRRGFLRAIRTSSSRCVIAEIKRASPSRGIIRSDFEPARHATDYERAGATCVSVLTDERFFGGSLDDLTTVRNACRLPLLRKDFLIDAYQVVESRAYGADAVLLIVAALEAVLFDELLAAAKAEGLDALVEVHNEHELAVALERDVNLIGINNRDLRTFATTVETSRRLISAMPTTVTAIAESGLYDRSQLEDLESRGIRGFLIGEALMTAPDPGKALATLLRP